MKSHDIVRGLRAAVDARGDLVMEHFPLRYAGSDQKYEFVRITSENFRTAFRPEKWLLITAGFHGNEKAGPLTILAKFDEIVEEAHSRGIGLVIYPLINPAGFDSDQRYGPDGRGRANCGNNDFIRYVLADGRIVDDLGDKRDDVRFVSWHPIKMFPNDPRPAETVRLHACVDYDLKQYGLFAGSVDLHQDRFLSGPAAYHYALGDRLPFYADIVKGVEASVGRIFRNMVVDSGESSPAMSDELGCVERHDGSISDYLHRLGVQHTVVVETTGDTPTFTAFDANMIWIRGILGLIAAGK